MQFYKLVICIAIISPFVSYSQTRIKMDKMDGVYTVPCVINGLKMRFIFDTGASNVSIAMSEARFMLRNGYLNKEDILGTGKSVIANGEIIENSTINIRELEIAGIKMYNIQAIVVHEMEAPLLLGQSAIQKLGTIQLDGDEMIILKTASIDQKSNNLKVSKMLIDASDNTNNGFYELAVNLYEQAHEIDSRLFANIDYFHMGRAYCSTKKYSLGIACFEKIVESGNESERNLASVYYRMALAYSLLNEHSNTLLYCQKAVTLDPGSAAQNYRLMGTAYVGMGDYDNAKEHYGKAFQKEFVSLIDNKEATIDGFNKALDKKKIYIKNVFIGNCAYNVGLCEQRLGNLSHCNLWMAYAATFGCEDALKLRAEFGQF